MPEREQLYEKINNRVDKMISLGLVDEVKRLLELAPKAHALGSIGYRQVAQHLRGEIDLEQAVHLTKRDTRRLAKRQYTWWNNQPQTLGWQKQAQFSFDRRTNYVISKALNEAVEQFSSKLLMYMEGAVERVEDSAEGIANEVRGGPDSKLEIANHNIDCASVNRLIPYLIFEAGPF